MQCQRSIMQTSPLRHNLVRRVTVISSLFCHGEHVLFVTRVTTSIHVSINSACSWDPFFMILPCFLWIFLDQIILCSVGTRISSLFSPRSLCFLINLSQSNALFFFLSDRVIKIWRLFPFAQEALAPLMTLYCHETPRLLSVAHHKLCAAFHEPSTASYNTVVFKTTQKSK